MTDSQRSNVFFRRWKGAEYGSNSPWGMPVMILGESFYGDDEGAKNPDFAILLITDAVKDGYRNTFLDGTACAFLGKSPDDKEYRGFWNSVVYHVYVQESVGPSARSRPTPDMWRRGEQGFLEVLAQYQPGFVLAVGKGLYENLPNCGAQGPTISLPDGASRESWLYPNSRGDALTFSINHPSSWKFRGQTYQDWEPWVASALEQAKRWKVRQTKT
jgi:hypothetical protein